jgi:hypothetical protein
MNSHATSEFFESYRAAFGRFESAAVAEHFAFPLQITGEGREVEVTSIQDRSTWIESLDRLLEMYLAIGVADASIVELEQRELSPRLRTALVRWLLRDGKGETLYEFSAAYTLAQVGSSLRVTAIAHNEVPRYRECLQRLRSRP